MPVLYVAIGRRLGYPLYLVQAREHFFVRWEEPGGERFNIEATTLGFTPRDDEHFRHWPRPIRRRRGSPGHVFEESDRLRKRRRRFSASVGSAGSTTCGPSRPWRHLRRQAECIRGSQACSVRGPLHPILHRAVKYFGREGLFATPAAEIELPPSEQPWEPQVRPLALEQLRRIVTNYQARGLPAASTSVFVVCQS